MKIGSMKFGYCWVAVAVAALLCATGVAGDGASAPGKKVITAPQRDVLLRHGREGLDLTSAEARFGIYFYFFPPCVWIIA